MQAHYPTIRLPPGVDAPYVHVVVDCQPGFKTSAVEWMTQALVASVSAAIADGAPVVVLEMSPGMNLDTHQCILDLLKVHPRCKVSKYRLDGSPAVQAACLAGGFPTKRFRLCGVQLDRCVWFTVVGLLALYPEAIVELDYNACNSELDGNPLEQLLSAVRSLGEARSSRFVLINRSPS